VTRQAVDRAMKDALARMRQKGLLWADLPAEVSGVQTQVTRAIKKGELARAADLVEQLDAAINAVQIDADFIDRKFKWLNEIKKNRPPAAAQAENVKSLLRRVTQLVGDGQFAAANQELNRIHALLVR
jgi:lipopolysaccharide biosynthesis protein